MCSCACRVEISFHSFVFYFLFLFLVYYDIPFIRIGAYCIYQYKLLILQLLK